MDALQNMQNMRDNEKIARKSHSVLAKRHNEAAEVNVLRIPDPVSRGYIKVAGSEPRVNGIQETDGVLRCGPQPHAS